MTMTGSTVRCLARAPGAPRLPALPIWPHRARTDRHPPLYVGRSRGDFMRNSGIAAALGALALVAAGCKAVVTPAKANGWIFLNEGAAGSAYFVNGPGDPPAGRGSALLTIDGSGRQAIATPRYAGIKLAQVSRLEYSTYQAYSGSPSETLYLQFDVDYDRTD